MPRANTAISTSHVESMYMPNAHSLATAIAMLASEISFRIVAVTVATADNHSLTSKR